MHSVPPNSGTANTAQAGARANASGTANAAAAGLHVNAGASRGQALGDVGSAAGASLAQSAGAVQGDKPAQQGGEPTPLKVGGNGLSVRNPDANASYVFETRAQFANHGQWIGSDYLLKALDMDPATTQKRLGDAFYEQRLVREQLDELTGRAPRNGASDDSRYKELLTSGISYAKEYGLRPGISLSAEQVAHLTSDIVWLESRNVVLPDGSSDTVLVPKVYLAHAGAGAVKAGGALVTGDGVEIKTTEGGIVNRGGLIDGANGRTMLTSAGDLLNQGGAIRGGALELKAGGDIVNQTLSIKQEYGGARPGSVISGSFTSLSNQASIVATGTLKLDAGRDVADTGGLIRAAGASVTAGRDIAFNTVQTGGSSEWKASGFTGSSSGVDHQASQLNSSGDLSMKAGRDLALSGTQAAADGKGALEAGRALSVAAVKNESRLDVSNDAHSKTYDKAIVHDETVAGAAVSAGGDLTLKAGVKETGALSLLASGVAGGGKVELRATGDVAITQLQEEHLLDLANHREWKSTFKKGSSDSADYSAGSHVVGSSVTGAGVAVHSGGDLAVTASQLTATDVLSLDAGRDLVVASAEQSGSERHSSQVKQSGFSLNLSTGIGYSKSQDDKSGNGDTVRQIGSVLSGGSIAASSGRDTLVKASTVVADGKLSIDAKGDLSIVSAADRDTGDYATSSKKSGSIGSNFQPAIGNVKTTTDGTHANSTQVGSQIASLGGDVELTAGGRYTQTASQVKAVEKDIAITAKDVLVNAGYSTTDSTDHTTYAKTAIGGTVSVPLIDAVKGIKGMVDAGKTTKDSRMQALAATNIAANAFDGIDSAANLAKGDMTGIKISVSLGNTKSESNTVQSANVAVGSTIAAGGSVNIKATGGGKDSNITAIGSDISAGKDITLFADSKVDLLAAESTVSQHSTNSSSGTSIGIGIALGGAQNGLTFDFAASKARGSADGDDLSHSNSHVKGGGVVTVTSGGDTNVKGGVISGEKVVAQIGGSFNVESLQDSSKYASKQVSAGFNVSICPPPVCVGASTVGASFSKAKAQGDFLSVIEQSGIKAGDGGFQLNVTGKTQLDGGVVSSSDKAIAAGANFLNTAALTTSDIANHASASASSSGYSLSSDMFQRGKYGASKGVLTNALGSTGDEGDSSGQTRGAVSVGAVAISDEALQLQLSGKSSAEAIAGLNRDTANAHVVAQKQDVQSMKATVEADQAIKQETIKTVTKLTDEAYRSRMEVAPGLYKVECLEASCVNAPKSVTGTLATMDDIKNNTDQNMVLATNGIFNNLERGLQLAYQNAENVEKTDANPFGEKPKTIFLMHVNAANNSLSELMAVGYEKLINSVDYGTANFLGYTNGAETYAALLASRGEQPTNSLAHSRGTLTQQSSFTILANRPDIAGNFYTNPNLTVRGVGGAANVQEYTAAAAKIINDPAKNVYIAYNYFSNDPVSTSIFSGGNPGAWTLMDLWQVYDTDHSMHSCYGSGASNCTQVESPLPFGPRGTTTGNTMLIQYLGGVRTGENKTTGNVHEDNK